MKGEFIMARSIEKWLEEVVNPDPILGPVLRGEKKALGDIYNYYFLFHFLTSYSV